MLKPIHVIGGGLAGCEAAWQIARAGVPVVLHEMRPVRMTEAHQTDRLAELVCSNSFRSDDASRQRRRPAARRDAACGSLIMRTADANQVPAGGALAVDRDGFSAAVQHAIAAIRDRDPPRGDRRPAAGRVGQRHRRDRPPHLDRRSPTPSAR